VAVSGLLEPLSHSARDILRELIRHGLIPGRKQETSILIFTRDQAGKHEFLLRWNPRWGYALPAKRKESTEDALAITQGVAREELGLDPSTDLTLSPAKVPQLQTSGITRTKDKPGYGAPTDYEHWIFDSTLHNPGKLQSAEPLAWVTEDEIHAGVTADEQTIPGSPPAKPHKISPTVFQVLSGGDYINWIG